MHNQPMQFEFDPVKAHSNLQKHGVSFAHAEQALRDDQAVTIEDPDAVGEQRFLTRLISARKASKNEAKNYHA